MRITLITNLFPNPAEPQRSTFNENQFLHLADFLDIDLIAPISWLDYRKLDDDQKNKIRSTSMWKDKIKISYPLYYYLPRILRPLAGFGFLASILPAWKIAKARHPDLVFSSWAYPDGFASVLLGMFNRLPVIIKVHGSDVEYLRKDCLSTRMTLWAMKRANLIISVSNYLKQQLVSLGVDETKIAVIYNGVDRNLFKKADMKATEKYFVYIGNLKREKGINDLVEAVDKNKLSLYKSQLYVVGDGAERPALEKIIREKDLGEQVKLLGRLPHDRLSELVRRSLFVCLPSHHEGIPNVLIEAISSGVPVLATNVGGIPEIVNESNGMLVKPSDISALQKAIAKMHETSWDKDAIVASSRIGSWNDSARRIYEHILKLAG